MSDGFVDFGKIPRLSRNCVITEKIDGTNVQILIQENTFGRNTIEDLGEVTLPEPIAVVDNYNLWAGSRNRWITPEKDNYGFARWVVENAEKLVNLGPGRHFGEWWGAGIQRRYGLSEKRFSLFNTYRWSEIPENILLEKFNCYVVPTLYTGLFSSDVVEEWITRLTNLGSAAAPGFMDPEGIMIYHEAAKQYFKKTIKDDEVPKGSKEAA